MIHLIYLFLLLFVPDVFAGPFDPPPTDKSVSLLGIIFGANVGDIYLGGTANPVLSDLMEKFNFIIVVVGSVVVSYVAILSTINTAQEGTAMGKKWSAVWIPMRSVAGMALMVPAPASGYSMIQVTVMWIILQGIGAADSLWNIALDGLKSGVSATSGSVSTAGLSTYGLAVAKQVLNAAICMQSLYEAASTQENIDGNTWINQNGQYIKNFSVPDAGYPQLTGTKPNRVATMKGYSYFGINNPNDPEGMAICGKLRVIGTVTEKDDYPSSALGGEFSATDAQLKQQAQQIYDTKLNVISSMLQVSQGLVDGLVSGQYTQPLIPGSFAINAPPQGYGVQMVNAYTSIMKSLVVPNTQSATTGQQILQGLGTQSVSIPISGGTGATDFSGTTSFDNSVIVQQVIDQGKTNGWISAGSFYFIFNRTLTSLLFRSANDRDAMINDDPTNPIPNCAYDDRPCIASVSAGLGFNQNSPSLAALQRNGVQSSTDLRKMAENLAEGSTYLQVDYAKCRPDANGNCQSTASETLAFPEGADVPNEAGRIMGILNNAGADIIAGMRNMLNSSGEEDPLLAHSLFGRSIMLNLELAFISILLVIMLLWPMSALPFVGGFFATLAQGLFMLASFVLPFAGIAWSFGAMLAIYTPLIPYMIFTMATIGWLMTVVEAVIAGPIIALGIVIPSGDELGRIEQALMILANIFLRPMLMIFGFLLAGRLYKAAVTLVDFGMGSVFDTINVGTLFSWIVIIVIYITFIVSITNLCFSLIYAVPDKILRWLGGTPEQTQADLSEVKGKAQETAGAIGKAGKDFAGEKMEEGSAKAGQVKKNDVDFKNAMADVGRLGKEMKRDLGKLFGKK